MESYDTELKKLVDEREHMIDKIKDMKTERTAKLKFLASALFMCTALERKIKGNKQRQVLQSWRQNVYLQKVLLDCC